MMSCMSSTLGKIVIDHSLSADLIDMWTAIADPRNDL